MAATGRRLFGGWQTTALGRFTVVFIPPETCEEHQWIDACRRGLINRIVQLGAWAASNTPL